MHTSLEFPTTLTKSGLRFARGEPSNSVFVDVFGRGERLLSKVLGRLKKSYLFVSPGCNRTTPRMDGVLFFCWFGFPGLFKNTGLALPSPGSATKDIIYSASKADIKKRDTEPKPEKATEAPNKSVPLLFSKDLSMICFFRRIIDPYQP